MIDFAADHFALFGMPRRFRIDAAALDRAYRALQAEVHPDRFAAADDASRRLALQSSARANEAYETLRDPAARGEYLLDLAGIVSLSETDTAMPMEFLAEQMERREAIDDARAAGDHAALEVALDAIVADTKTLEAELAGALDDANDLPRAKTLVRKLRFLQRVRQEITDALIEAEA
jgi:molecular chaperone HscB